MAIYYFPRNFFPYLENSPERALPDIANVDDVVPGIFQLLQLRVELRSGLVVGLVLGQLVQVDGSRRVGGCGCAVLGDGSLVAGLGAAADPVANQD